MPRSLIVVGVQNGFCEDESLAVTGGTGVAAGISSFLAAHRSESALARDAVWAQRSGESLLASTPVAASSPAQCVDDAPEAALHRDLDAVVPFLKIVDVIMPEGQCAAAHSGFEGHTGDERALPEIRTMRE